jgi:hypothetical protein
MSNLLLHHPWLHFYLLYAGAWLVVYLWYFLLRPAAQKKTPPSVSGTGWRPEKEVGPTSALRTWDAPRAGVVAPTSGKRRDHHVVTP